MPPKRYTPPPAPVPASRALAPKKPTILLPPPPPGNVHDLPPITRRQKETLLKDLMVQIQNTALPFINDISTRTVFGEGDCDAGLLFVGEGPGAEEDKTGRPFVGRSGQLLDKMINAIGYKREQVFILNIVKLRAAGWNDEGTRLQDRPPTPEEVARWLPSLHQQIEIIRPKVIVTLGAPAVKYLTGTTEGVMKIRGTWLAYRGIPVMPTYHPSFVLRAYTEENRRKVWNDLKEAKKYVEET
jgi:DNA polymerase